MVIFKNILDTFYKILFSAAHFKTKFSVFLGFLTKRLTISFILFYVFKVKYQFGNPHISIISYNLMQLYCNWKFKDVGWDWYSWIKFSNDHFPIFKILIFLFASCNLTQIYQCKTDCENVENMPPPSKKMLCVPFYI